MRNATEVKGGSPTGIVALRVPLYSVSVAVAIWQAWICIVIQRRQRSSRTGLTVIFPIFITLAFLLRGTWCVLISIEHDERMGVNKPNPELNLAAHCVNRVVFATFFTAYSFVAAHLWRARGLFTGHLYVKNKDDLRVWRVFLATNALVYFCEVTDIISRACWPNFCADNGPCYHVGVVGVGCLFLILAVSFLGFVLQSFRFEATTKARRWKLRVLLISSVLVAFLFTARFVLFCWRLFSGMEFPPNVNDVLYPYFYYDVPELLGSWVLMWVIHPGRRLSLNRRANVDRMSTTRRQGNYGAAGVFWGERRFEQLSCVDGFMSTSPGDLTSALNMHSDDVWLPESLPEEEDCITVQESIFQ